MKSVLLSARCLYLSSNEIYDVGSLVLLYMSHEMKSMCLYKMKSGLLIYVCESVK